MSDNSPDNNTPDKTTPANITPESKASTDKSWQEISCADIGSALQTRRGTPVDSNTPQEESYIIDEQPGTLHKLPLQSVSGSIAHVLTWTLWAYYLYQRLLLCQLADSTWALWSLWYCEVALVLSDLQTALELTLSWVPTSTEMVTRPRYKLLGDKGPMIHVLITVCGEDIDVVMDTINGAASQDYPVDCYQVFVLDDNSSEELREAIENFNKQRAVTSPNHIKFVVYLARKKPANLPHFYKSGNLRFGLEITANEYGDSSYFAALDADMIPEQDWLSRTIPHMINGPELAMVGSPQLSYNIPKDDQLSQDSNVFAHVLEPVHDKFGASQCSGSGYIMRRTALDSIGGWPLANVGEDIVCSYLLADKGWKIGFIPDQLQYGMAPGSFHAYIMQRMRWTDGSLLVAKKFRFFLPFIGDAGQRTPMQRLFAMLHAFKAYLSVLSFAAMLAIPISLLSISLSHESVVMLRGANTRLYIFLWLCLKVSAFSNYGKLGMKNYSNMSKNRRWIAPFNAFCVIRSMFTNLSTSKFIVTGSYESPANERSADTRQPLPGRLLSKIMLLYISYIVFASAALLAWTHRAIVDWRAEAEQTQTVYMHTGAVIVLIDIIWGILVPIKYMISPPTVSERRELLHLDENGVYRPRYKGWQKRDGSLFSSKDVLLAALILGCDWL